MKRPSVFLDRHRGLDVKMTPMIDVVFLLLVFFVWTASFHAVEYLLPSQLSAATGTQPTETNDPPPPEEDFDDIVIRLKWAGDVSWQLNDAAVGNLAELRERLTAIARIKEDAPVIIHPDEQVPLGDVIDVYDVARMVGFVKVQFTASP